MFWKLDARGPDAKILTVPARDPRYADLRDLPDVPAAVIEKENGKRRLDRRMDRPRARSISGAFGSGVLPRKELKEAAAEPTASEAGLIMVGEPAIEQVLDKAIANAAKVAKTCVDATTDEIASELWEALKSEG